MDDSNKKEFAVLFYGLGEYYDKKVSKNLLVIYFDDLKKYDIAEVKRAASEHRLDPKGGVFFPKSADIIRHLQDDLSVGDKAELAWSQVMHKIRVTGSYGSLNIDDKQAMAAVRALGSWQSLCGTLESDMTWKKKEFMSLYNTYEKTPLDMLPSSLPGLIELQDHKKEISETMKKIMAGIPQSVKGSVSCISNKKQ